jgi:serine/threonine protein phosphatase PrpC
MYALGFGHTDKGQKRGGNEDAFLLDNDLGLFMVCDGMGGRASGEVASATAVQIVKDRFEASAHLLEQVSKGKAPYPEVISLAVKVVHEACAEINRLASENRKHAGMGTTLTLLLMSGAPTASR